MILMRQKLNQLAKYINTKTFQIDVKSLGKFSIFPEKLQQLYGL